jgi:dihydroxyacid dehydratase/phosphogluconate dehydratase
MPIQKRNLLQTVTPNFCYKSTKESKKKCFRAGGMAEVLEHLLNNEALNSNSNSVKKKIMFKKYIENSCFHI